MREIGYRNQVLGARFPSHSRVGFHRGGIVTMVRHVVVGAAGGWCGMATGGSVTRFPLCGLSHPLVGRGGEKGVHAGGKAVGGNALEGLESVGGEGTGDTGQDLDVKVVVTARRKEAHDEGDGERVG